MLNFLPKSIKVLLDQPLQCNLVFWTKDEIMERGRGCGRNLKGVLYYYEERGGMSEILSSSSACSDVLDLHIYVQKDNQQQQGEHGCHHYDIGS